MDRKGSSPLFSSIFFQRRQIRVYKIDKIIRGRRPFVIKISTNDDNDERTNSCSPWAIFEFYNGLREISG